jgi:hypothetical protein
MLRRVALVRTDVSDELSASFIRVARIGELGTTLPVTSNQRTLRRNTRHNIPVDAILYSHRRENLKSYIGGCLQNCLHGTNTQAKVKGKAVPVLVTLAGGQPHAPVYASAENDAHV